LIILVIFISQLSILAILCPIQGSRAIIIPENKRANKVKNN